MADKLLQVKKAELLALGFIVGDRDPRRNTDFEGKFMVAEPCEEHELPTKDASSGGFCVVGDDLDDLIVTAHKHF